MSDYMASEDYEPGSEQLRRFSARNWPTQEEKLDLFFNSIVATCRSVVLGTSPGRTLGECWVPPMMDGDGYVKRVDKHGPRMKSGGLKYRRRVREVE